MRLRDKILFIMAGISAVTILAMVSTAQPRPTDNTTIQGKWFVNAATWGDIGDSPYPIEEIRNWCWTFEGGKFEWNGAPPGKRNARGERVELSGNVDGKFELSREVYPSEWRQIDLTYGVGAKTGQTALGIYVKKKKQDGRDTLSIRYQNNPDLKIRPIDLAEDTGEGCTTVILLRERNEIQ